MQPEVKALQNIFVRWDKSKPARQVCKEGDRLEILHDGGTALVVQNISGEKFSVETKQTDYER